MVKINIYQMNLNPCMIDKRREKSENIRAVFKAYKKDRDEEAKKEKAKMGKTEIEKVEMGKVEMHSFKPLDNGGYSKYVDYRMESITEPTIVIFSNIFDLATRSNTAYSRLVYASSKENIKAIYFTDYSLEKNFKVDTKLIAKKNREEKGWKDDELGLMFRDKVGTKPSIRRAYIPEEVREAIATIRKEANPALLYDMAEVLDLSYSMIRRAASYNREPYKSGDPINERQKKHLIDAYESARVDEFLRFKIKKEKYIP